MGIRGQFIRDLAGKGQRRTRTSGVFLQISVIESAAVSDPCTGTVERGPRHDHQDILTRMGRFRTPGPGLRDAEYTGAQIRHAADGTKQNSIMCFPRTRGAATRFR